MSLLQKISLLTSRRIPTPPQTLTTLLDRFVDSFVTPSPSPQLCLDSLPVGSSSTSASSTLDDLISSLWLAVPKSKISKSKKRIKNHRYKLKNKTHIMKDPATNEWTERHRLPINWKFYLRPDGYGKKNVDG
eukprot:CAMPEP_0118651536 /NCGR_PEP_ID=MMETSP0785-20121206/10838_1 /TAXON_ID=91992 /ORGANISM="Bolidomonas pacifica, Strain CCMP 1866" /LENGTH=131 /DNA_ID=CAMNT_0006543995 /DNA_START=207 /DNA_END=599 /DNA_ORIENTATION=+